MKNNKFVSIIVASILLFTGCDLDINNDPNRTTIGELHLMLPNAQKAVAYSFTSEYYLGDALSSYVSHLSLRETDNYSVDPSNVSLSNTWTQTYVDALTNVESIINEAEATNNTYYAGIAKLLKAYLFGQMVDLWGDIPYSQSFILGNYTPEKDSGKDIYNQLLLLIDSAIADLSVKADDGTKNVLKPSTDDIIYGGSTAKWKKMGNTLKLKLLVNSRKAKSDITGWDTQLAALLTKKEFIGAGEDFEFKHFKIDNPEQRNPAYVDQYPAGQQTNFISPWIYEIMNGMTLNVKDNPFDGITDPRMPYYWVNQLKEDGTAQNPTDYRDGAFVSLFFASNASATSNDQRSTTTYIGIYAAGGKYDNKSGGRVGDSSLWGANAPSKMLQKYSIPFLLAELYLTNEATGDARKMLEEGITEAINHVNTVSQAAKGTNAVPTISVKDDSTKKFLESVLAKYDAATTVQQKLKIVMTQKWIANYFNPVEAYTDYRRTGYPTLISPTTTSAKSPYFSTQKPTVGPMDIRLKTITAYPRVLWYPTREVNSNPNMTNVDRNITSKVVFWDK